MDVIVLNELENGNLIGGHDMIALIHKRFHLLVSPGTVYALLYSMERDGLIEGIMTSKKRSTDWPKRAKKNWKKF